MAEVDAVQLTDAECGYLSRLLAIERAKWTDRMDAHASHSRIAQRDRAARNIAAIDAISDKLWKIGAVADPAVPEQPEADAARDLIPLPLADVEDPAT